MKEKNIQELAIRMGLITVEDMCQYTIAQLVVKVANKVNELVNEVWRFETDVQEIVKTQNENIQYLLGEGLHLEVGNIFDGWVQDGTFDRLLNQKALKKVNERIDETNAQLSQKANKTDVFTMANMGQDVKEAMTGGSVAVVGKDTILTENIVDGQVVANKTNFVEFVNLLDNFTPKLNTFLASKVGISTINNTSVSEANHIVAIINVINGETLTIKKGTKRILLYMYDNTGVLRYYAIHEDAKYTFKCKVDGYTISKIAIVSESLDHQLFKGSEIILNVESKETTQSIREVKDANLRIKNIENNFFYENKIDVFTVNSLENSEVFGGEAKTISVIKFSGTSEKNYYTVNIVNPSNQKVNMFYFCYDKSNSVIASGSLQNTSNGYRTLEIDIESEVTVVELKIRNYGTSSIFIKDVYFGNSKYSNKLKELQSYLNEVIENSSSLNKLYGKNITCFGDSITYGAENNDISYVNKIAKRNNMQIYKRAVSGATFVNHSGRNCIMNQVQDFINEGKSNLDYIILSGGYNDSQASVSSPIGTINEMDYSGKYDTTTLLGAVETCLYKLISTYPKAKLLAVITFKVDSNFESYRTELLKAYLKWGVLVSDLSVETPLVASKNHPTGQIYFSHADTGITVHPNDEGQEIMSVSVENKLALM